jgi:hypothetical protein
MNVKSQPTRKEEMPRKDKTGALFFRKDRRLDRRDLGDKQRGLVEQQHHNETHQKYHKNNK